MIRWGERWRARIVVCIAAALMLLGIGSFVRRVGAATPRVGAEWVQSSAGPLALRVDPQGAAARAGLAEGDLLVAIAGRDVTSVLDATQLGWDAEVGGSVAIRVRRAGRDLALHVGPDWRLRTEPYIYLAIVGLAFWLSGLLVALRWPLIRAGTAYSLLAASLFAHLTLSHTGAGTPFDWAIYAVDLASGAIWPALLLHVGIAVTKRTLPWRRVALGLAYLTSALLVGAAAWLSPAAAGGALHFSDPVLAVETRDRVETLFVALAMALTAWLLAKSKATSSSVMHRSQMRWMLRGLLLGLGPFVLLHAVPWAVGAPELPDWARFLAVLPMLVVPATFTVALARYRLHDLDLLLLRGFSEAGAVFASFAVLAATVFLLRDGLSDLLPLSRSATRYVGLLAAVLAYPQMRAWTRAGVERAFYRQRYSYRATLLDWARELNTETDLLPLLARLRQRICDTLGVSAADVLLRTGPGRFEPADTSGGAGTLELDPAALERLERASVLALEPGELPDAPWARYLFSMNVKGSLRAVLAIAERGPLEEPLSGEDRALLGTLAAHAATAIEAARLLRELRRRAEEVEALHARQASVLENSAVGLLLLDRDERILAWNRALEEIDGLPRERALGRPLAEVFPLHVVRRIEREIRASERGPAGISRLNMVNHRGERRVVNVTISPALAGGGGRVVTFDDATERSALEAQVLQQERLASLGLLAAGVAHEINTPLTGISGFTQMLLEDCDGEDGRRAVLEKVEAQARRASKIANSLLTLARPEHAAFEELDLNETVREALTLVAPQLRGRRIALETDLADGLPKVEGDRGRLQQVLINLLLNARDAVGDDGGRIAVSTRARAGGVVLEVADDGCGIAEEDLPRIFDPFFTTKGRGRGTGLGLAITYGIVREHDGTIAVESDVDAGTRLRVELPAARAVRAAAT